MRQAGGKVGFGYGQFFMTFLCLTLAPLFCKNWQVICGGLCRIPLSGVEDYPVCMACGALQPDYKAKSGYFVLFPRYFVFFVLLFLSSCICRLRQTLHVEVMDALIHDDCSATVQRGQLRSLTGSSKLSSTVACHVPVVLAVCVRNTIYTCYPVYYSTVRDHAQVYSFNTYIIYIYYL